MQRFSIALWNVIACIAIHVSNQWVTNVSPHGAGSVVRCRGIDLTPSPLLTGEGEAFRRPYCRAKVSPLRGDIEGSSRLFVRNCFIPDLIPEREWSGRSSRGIKA
jgi:hypothetical protein